MDHRGVAYTLRQGIERESWILVVHLPRGSVEKRVQSTKQKAKETACAMIDKWLEANGPKGGQRSRVART
jgi:hypothetical protein